MAGYGNSLGNIPRTANVLFLKKVRVKCEREDGDRGSDTARMGSRHHLRLQHRPQVRHRGGQSLAMLLHSGFAPSAPCTSVLGEAGAMKPFIL